MRALVVEMQIDMLQELFCMNICKGKAVRQDQGHRYLNKVFSMIHPASPLLRKCLGDTGHKSASLRGVFTRKPQKNYKWQNARSKWPCSNGRRSGTSLPLLWAIPGLSCWLTANGGIKPGYRFERGCHVEMYMHISQELFCAKICNNLAGHG